MSRRVLVTISRSWRQWDQVREVLARLHAHDPGTVLVHGACARGDRDVAVVWRDEFGGADEPWPADWSLGRRAGALRNNQMVASRPDLVIAFIRNSSRGASQCLAAAQKAGLVTRVYRDQAPGGEEAA